MLFTILLALSGLTLSAVAIYYSVIGLTAVFAASFWAVAIMGTTLEVSKLVAASWLKAYWDKIPLGMKVYMSTAVIVLMIITSMGIFGFLSKAHLDQNIVSGDVQSKIVLVDEKIKIERENIANAQQVIKQMDAAVTGVIATGDQTVTLRDGSTRVNSAAERSLQIRRSQAKDRDALTKQIEQAQSRIVTLQEEVAPIRAEMRQVEAKVGPIKYIAALIYGDNPDANILEKAVTWVIMIIVFVFDPLAILMLLGAQMTYKWHREKELAEGDSPRGTTDVIDTEPPTVTTQPKEEINLDYINQQLAEAAIVPEPIEPDTPKQTVKFVDHGEHPKDNFGYEAPVSVPVVEDTLENVPPAVSVKDTDELDLDNVDDSTKVAMRQWKEDHPDETIKELRLKKELGIIDRLPWEPAIAEVEDESSKKKTTYIIKQNNQQITKTKD
jgi:hypothetical protein